jgi:hypothetical protein
MGLLLLSISSSSFKRRDYGVGNGDSHGDDVTVV